MDIKRIVIGTIAGTVTLYVIGYVLFEIIWASFYAANVTSARPASLQWAVLAGNLCFALLVTLAIETRTGAPSIASGFITGAVIGFLAWLGAHLSYYATVNVITLNIVMIDPLNELIHTGIAGAAIAAVLARIPRSAGFLAT